MVAAGKRASLLLLLLGLFLIGGKAQTHDQFYRHSSITAPSAPYWQAHDEAARRKAREAWFERNRISLDRRSPAEHWLSAWRQRQRLPVARPPAHRLAAAAAGAKITEGANLPSVGGDWTSLGPQPETEGRDGAVSGRITSLAVDLGKDPTGNTVYVGAAFGGVWMSTNALSATPTFKPLDDQMPSLAIGSIALDDTTTPTTIYAGTGEANNSGDSYYGVGILKSTDGGHTWTLSSSADGGKKSLLGLAFSRIVVDPIQPGIVLAAAASANLDAYNGLYTNENEMRGLYRSTDGGQTWSMVLDVSDAQHRSYSCTDIVYDPGAAAYYAAMRGHGIYRSTDSGATWTALPSPFPSGTAPTLDNFYRASLAVRSGAIYAIVAGVNDDVSAPQACTDTATRGCDTGLEQSSDGGATWSPIAVPSGLFCHSVNSCQGSYNQYVAAPPGSTSLLIAGYDVWQTGSLQGTATAWTNLTLANTVGTVHTDQHAIAMVDATHWYIGNDGGLWSTADAGAHWSDLNATLDTIQFISVTADASRAGAYFGGSQDNGTALTTSSSLTWNLIWGGDGGYTAQNPSNPLQYFTENGFVSLRRSDDAGNSFTTVVDAKTVNEPQAFYVPYQLMPGDPSTMVLGATHVWEGPATATNGVGWAPLNGDPIDGYSFCTSPSGYTSYAYITALSVAPSNPKEIAVGLSDGRTIFSKDATAAGGSWQGGGPIATCVPVGAIAIAPSDPNTIFYGFEGVGFSGSQRGHVYKTSDGGGTWVDISGDLPDAPVNSILIDPQAPNNVFVATDVGVFLADDGGTAGEGWAPWGSSLPNSAVLQLQFAQGGKAIVAATHGRGAWTIPYTPPPDYRVTLSPASQTIGPQHVATLTVAAIGYNGESQPISLTCTAPTSGCIISPTSISAGGRATVTLAAGALAPGGATTVIVSASDGTTTRTASAAITVPSFTLATTSLPTVVEVAGTATVSFWVQTQGTSVPFPDPINLSCSSPTPGFTCSFSANPLPAGGPFNPVSIAVANSVAPGSYSVTLTGSSDGLTSSATIPLTVHNYSLALGQESISVPAGSPAMATIKATSLSGYSGSIALSCQAQQVTASCQFSPSTIQPGQSSTMTISGYPDISKLPGYPYATSFGVQVSGASGSETADLPGGLSVDVGDFQLGTLLPMVHLIGVSNVSFTLWISPLGWPLSDLNIALTCAVAPPATCSVSSPAPIGYGPATVKVSGLGSLPASTLAVSYTGTYAKLTHSGSEFIQLADFALTTAPTRLDLLPGTSASLTPSIQAPPGLIQPDFTTNFPSTTTVLTCTASAPFTCAPATFNVYNGYTGGLTVGATGNATDATATGTATVAATVTDGADRVTHQVAVPVDFSDFSVAASPGSQTIAAGQIAAYTLTIGSINNFAQAVSLSCSGLPAESYCFSSSPGPLPPNGQVTIQLSIRTTAAGFALPFSGPQGPSLPGWLWIWVVGSLAALWRAWRSPARRRVGRTVAAALALLLTLAWVSCGGGSSGVSNYHAPGTPAGTSTVTVTASYLNAISHSTNLTLIVQ